MFRQQALLLGSLGLAVGCASSSSQNNVNNPDAGAVQYDVGAAEGGGADGGEADADGGAAPTRKGKDQTGTRSIGAPKKKAVKKIAAAHPPREEEPPAPKPGTPTPNGLLVEYFKIEAATADLPDFAALGAPFAHAIAPTVDFTGGAAFAGLPSNLGQNFAARFTGSLNVVRGAEYNLCLTSSDGSQLLLDGGLIVDNGGAHEVKQACELVFMDPGEYEVTLVYFNVGDDATLKWTWDVGGAGDAVVPEGSLFKPEGADAKVSVKPRAKKR